MEFATEEDWVKFENSVNYPTPLTFSGYIVKAAEKMRVTAHWRPGQAYFNVLRDVRPDLAEQIRGGWRDPFYNSTIVPDFLAWVAENWDKEPGSGNL